MYQGHRAYARGLHLIFFELQVAEWLGLGGPAAVLQAAPGNSVFWYPCLKCSLCDLSWDLLVMKVFISLFIHHFRGKSYFLMMKLLLNSTLSYVFIFVRFGVLVSLICFASGPFTQNTQHSFWTVENIKAQRTTPFICVCSKNKSFFSI